VAISGVVLRDALAGVTAVPLADSDERVAALELVRCKRVNVSGSQFLDPAPNGVYVEDCADVLLTGCTVLEDRAAKKMEAAVRWKGGTEGSLIAVCRLGRGTQGVIVGPDELRRETVVE
jgi:hypothetical protein